MQKLMRKIGLIVLLYLFPVFLWANYVRITKEIEVKTVESGVATLEFGLAWDNSWRDNFNWDAVWVFLKYKEVATEGSKEWMPLLLEESGCDAGTDFVCMPGKTAEQTTGLFLFRANTGNYSTNKLTCRLKWKLPSDCVHFTKADFEEQQIIFLVQAVEMVFVPYKPYKLGDGYSKNSFGDTLRNALTIDSERAQQLTYRIDDLDVLKSVAVNPAYPKGYKGMYMMKYEISQDQYVRFLNALTREEQERLLPHTKQLKEGSYVFGRVSVPSFRNGIYLVHKPLKGGPMRFECNLRNDGAYGMQNDGQAIACNYMAPADMLAYCAWAGLRPMSELEYEKACRRLFPQEPEPGEYAWNNAVDPVFVSSVINSGMTTESIMAGCNVNAGNQLDGPLRCGVFARPSGNQELAGGSYWGVMEMSGNLKELCYNIRAGEVFDGHLQGLGKFDLSRWPTSTDLFGLRGGGFTSDKDRLRTSDRAEAEAYKIRDFFYRDSTVTFRGVRSIEDVAVDPGEIACQEGNIVCAGLTVNLISKKEASIENVANIPVEYVWYLDGKLLPDVVGKSIKYTLKAKEEGRTYVFVRKVITALGEAETSLTLNMPESPFTTSYQLFENPGSSVQVTIAEEWKNNISYNCWLDPAISGITVNKTGLVSGISANSFPFFKVKIAATVCPDVIYEKDIRIARTYAYTGGEQSVYLEKGNYKMECWGAQGGRPTAQNRGGYSYGELALPLSKRLYMHIGQAGSVSIEGSYNGGGGGGLSQSGQNPPFMVGGSGGGATDIRLESGVWSDVRGLRSRIMVAGGGGGNQSWTENRTGCGGGCYAGSGGGFSGSPGLRARSDVGNNPEGGTQRTGYAFGIGGKGRNAPALECARDGGGGGGGGYYGGMVQNSLATFSDAGGGGGSGFVSGLNGCDALDKSGNHTGQPNHYSELIFQNAGMQNAVNTGDGRVRIERIK